MAGLECGFSFGVAGFLSPAGVPFFVAVAGGNGMGLVVADDGRGLLFFGSEAVLVGFEKEWDLLVSARDFEMDGLALVVVGMGSAVDDAVAAVDVDGDVEG